MIWPILHPKSSVYSVTSVAINYLRKQRNLRLRMNRSTFVEKPLQIHPFLKKQTQFFPVFSPKTTICPKTKPIQTQSNPIFGFIQSWKYSVNQCESVSKIIPFYAKRTQTSSFSAQKQQFSPKTNPKRTQIKPKQSQIEKQPK